MGNVMMFSLCSRCWQGSGHKLSAFPAFYDDSVHPAVIMLTVDRSKSQRHYRWYLRPVGVN